MTTEIIQKQINKTRCDVRADGCLGIRPEDGGEDDVQRWGIITFEMPYGHQLRIDVCVPCLLEVVSAGPGIREALHECKTAWRKNRGPDDEEMCSMWDLIRDGAQDGE